MRLRCLALLPVLCLLVGCAARGDAAQTGPQPVGSMALAYAEQFSVDYYEGGAALVSIGQERCLLVPEGAEAPALAGVPVLHTPLENLYLASSGAMDAFVQLDALPSVRFTSTEAADWSIGAVVDALEAETLCYVGKYRAPDYERLLAEGCSLALENTMLLHSPATREQLEALGIPVLIERSSYETHPLGRMEWIKLYALLVGREAEAEAFFARETAALSGILDAEPTGKTAAFFFVSPNGWINVRRAGDYIPKMLELAGGRYVPAELTGDGSAQSSMNLQPEAFYAGAKDADVLIYNANIYPVDSIAQLVAQNDLFADFKAVREGSVWVTEQNVFQQTTAVGAMIADFHAVLSGTDADTLTYLHRLH
ncbi:MAG: ABC transporter substrate-binding protein [Oscillospiraceae bacterium]|nr:ABC transporter substrate-binding protein [Oscillospiraceae bacterium]